MKRTYAALLLLIFQLLIVLSVAGKYLYERSTRPAIWMRASPYDPSLPVRGRYLALELLVDGCALPRTDAYYENYGVPMGLKMTGMWTWPVYLRLRDGRLVPELNTARAPKSYFARDHSDGETSLILHEGKPCARIPVSEQVDFFLPEHAQTPFPLKPGEELWVLITIPVSGPPRPIKLAVFGPAGFQPLHLD